MSWGSVQAGLQYCGVDSILPALVPGLSGTQDARETSYLYFVSIVVLPYRTTFILFHNHLHRQISHQRGRPGVLGGRRRGEELVRIRILYYLKHEKFKRVTKFTIKSHTIHLHCLHNQIALLIARAI